MRNHGSSLARAFRLIDAFAPGEAAVPLAELARRAEMPKSTAHRLAAGLISWGALERTEGGLRLGLRLFEIGQMAPRYRVLRDAALPYLGELYEATHETVHLAVRDGHDLVYLEKLHARRGSPAPSRVGGRMPLHASALGKAILASSQRESVEEVLSHPLEPLTRRTLTRPQDLRAELTDVFRAGYAFDREETADGLSCVAAPIVAADGSALGALSLAGPTRGAFRPDRLAAMVKAAARSVAHAIAAAPSLAGSPSSQMHR